MPLPLTPAERQIFRTLARHRGQIVPIADLIPPPKWGAVDMHRRRRVFKVHMCRLRGKLRAAGFGRGLIETVPSGVRLGV